MTLLNIGFAQKSAETFFTLLSDNKIELLIDIRLNNKSQLAGFTKGDDLRFFLNKICGCAYRHCIEFAPSKDILEAYKKKEIDWHEYEVQYKALMEKRGDYLSFYNDFLSYQRIVFLCSEPTADYCHRRLLCGLIESTSTNVEVQSI